ncbi:hypothetical protein [Nakamurella sp.]|uniref:hypothetical protein n=1 Tax=Nakamurella sp. TaxID=1869182 RepID=UPI003B3A8745
MAVVDPEDAGPDDVADPDEVAAPEADGADAAVDADPADVDAAADESTELTPDGTVGADAVPPTLAQEASTRVVAAITTGSAGRRGAPGREGSVARSALRRPCDMRPFCQPG